jgi:HlyD family secretion protein
MTGQPVTAAATANAAQVTTREPVTAGRTTTGRAKRLLVMAVVVAVVASGAFLAWWFLWPAGLPPGIAASNGRIEATEIDVAAKIAGRIEEIFADEGDFVTSGQTLAKMDTASLEAERREAEAQLQRATIAVETAQSLVRQRESERAADVAVVAQREAELDAAQRRFTRSANLAPRRDIPEQRLDDDRANFQAAKAALSAAQAQVAAADAAISAAKSQIVDAQAAIEAAKATIERIQADIDDSTLYSPRDGRVQYRVAQPGEVLPAGGRVLNLVDLTDVYMTFYLPTDQAGRVPLGAEALLHLDAFPDALIPARITFVADVAQFTPKTVETAVERQKLMFRLKAQIPPELLRKHILLVKTGLPGMAYVKLDPKAEWPATLKGTLVQ